METLIAKNEAKKRWYPQPVDTYKHSIKIPFDTDENKRLNSNFAYSMQYIEYIEKQINELKLSEVILKMLFKSYIITGMGIIELLFVYLLKSTDHWNKTEWEEYLTFTSNTKEDGEDVIKTETKLFKKVKPYEMRMDLDSMIKKVEKRHLLTIDHNVFPALKKLRELRNRVHLQSGVGATDHDYNRIKLEEMQMMRRILYAILTAPELCASASQFEFIQENYKNNLPTEQPVSCAN